jgi:HEAT repeat protein
MLGNDRIKTRQAAIDILTEVGAAALPALMEPLRAGNLDARLAAIHVLGQLGPASRPAVPALRSLESDPDSEVGRAATNALRRIELSRNRP